MKKDELLSKGLTEEQIQFVMAGNGKDIQRERTKLEAGEADGEFSLHVRHVEHTRYCKLLLNKPPSFLFCFINSSVIFRPSL